MSFASLDLQDCLSVLCKKAGFSIFTLESEVSVLNLSKLDDKFLTPDDII
jgi:hypothetical protein